MIQDKETHGLLLEVSELLSRLRGGTPVANLSHEINRLEPKLANLVKVEPVVISKPK